MEQFLESTGGALHQSVANPEGVPEPREPRDELHPRRIAAGKKFFYSIPVLTL